jgi:AcrR family transcriptional regulator
MSRLTREQSRIATRERLRQAALDEFAYCGFAGASIDRIAEAAGFSRGAFYSNYASKHEIMLALMREQSAEDVGQWQELIRTHGGQSDLFAVIADWFEQFMQRVPWALFSVEAQLQARRDPVFAAEHRQYLSEIEANIAELIARLFYSSGKQVPDDLALLARGFYSLALGLFLSMDPASPDVGAKSAGAILARFFEGLISATQSAP